MSATDPTPSDDEIRAAALADGWTIERTMMYDEEAVEGWRWTRPDGREWSEIGDHNQPAAIPDAVRGQF